MMHQDTYDLGIQICDAHYKQSLSQGLSMVDWVAIDTPMNGACDFCDVEETTLQHPDPVELNEH